MNKIKQESTWSIIMIRRPIFIGLAVRAAPGKREKQLLSSMPDSMNIFGRLKREFKVAFKNKSLPVRRNPKQSQQNLPQVLKRQLVQLVRKKSVRSAVMLIAREQLMYQANLFHTKMLIKEPELQNYLFNTDIYEIPPKTRLAISNSLRQEMIEIFSGTNVF